MEQLKRVQSALGAAMVGAGSPLAGADRLCRACVQLLEVDGACLSLVHQRAGRWTCGASDERSRRLDGVQFTAGGGPCLDAVSSGTPVLAGDLDDPADRRWPGFTAALRDSGVGAVFALPVAISAQQIGALDLFCNRPGLLTVRALAGGVLAAELAALPLLDLLSSGVQAASRHSCDGGGWQQLDALDQVKVNQASGMIAEALDVDLAEALAVLRARASARRMSVDALAQAVVTRRVLLDTTEWQPACWPAPATGPATATS